MFDYVNFSKNIKFYRQELGYSQEMFAEKIGIAYKYLSEIERGISKPSISIMINILNVFHLTFEEFMEKNSKKETTLKKIEIQEILYYVKSFHPTKKQKEDLLDIVNIINESRN